MLFTEPAARAADSSALVSNQAGEVNSVNQRFNQQTQGVARDYGQALAEHLRKGTPFPTGFAEKFGNIEKSRQAEVRTLELRQEEDRNLVRKTQAGEIVQKLLPAARVQQLTQNSPGDGKVSDPKAGDKKAAAAIAPSRPEVVLDGSNLPKALEFRGKKKTTFTYDPNDPSSYGH